MQLQPQSLGRLRFPNLLLSSGLGAPGRVDEVPRRGAEDEGVEIVPAGDGEEEEGGAAHQLHVVQLLPAMSYAAFQPISGFELLTFEELAEWGKMYLQVLVIDQSWHKTFANLMKVSQTKSTSLYQG